MAAALTLSRFESRIEILTPHQLFPELAPEMADRPAVIFVDAEAGETPGAVMWSPVEFPHSLEISSAFSHHCRPAELLFLSSLFGKAPRAYSVTITGVSFETSECLSEPVREAIPKAIRTVARILGLAPDQHEVLEGRSL